MACLSQVFLLHLSEHGAQAGMIHLGCRDERGASISLATSPYGCSIPLHRPIASGVGLWPPQPRPESSEGVSRPRAQASGVIASERGRLHPSRPFVTLHGGFSLDGNDAPRPWRPSALDDVAPRFAFTSTIAGVAPASTAGQPAHGRSPTWITLAAPASSACCRARDARSRGAQPAPGSASSCVVLA